MSGPADFAIAVRSESDVESGIVISVNSGFVDDLAADASGQLSEYPGQHIGAAAHRSYAELQME
ncbi:MAG TPA: hypothetical protein VHC90_24865 [Bryobacteraceae bacterium]|nr:hypothetical protein [Bryobacteraceae bacterium]